VGKRVFVGVGVNVGVVVDVFVGVSLGRMGVLVSTGCVGDG
jgi:hypothetical protein